MINLSNASQIAQAFSQIGEISSYFGFSIKPFVPVRILSSVETNKTWGDLRR